MADMIDDIKPPLIKVVVGILFIIIVIPLVGSIAGVDLGQFCTTLQEKNNKVVIKSGFIFVDWKTDDPVPGWIKDKHDGECYEVDKSSTNSAAGVLELVEQFKPIVVVIIDVVVLIIVAAIIVGPGMQIVTYLRTTKS